MTRCTPILPILLATAFLTACTHDLPADAAVAQADALSADLSRLGTILDLDHVVLAERSGRYGCRAYVREGYEQLEVVLCFEQFLAWSFGNRRRSK